MPRKAKKKPKPSGRTSAHIRRVMVIPVDARGRILTGTYRTGTTKKGYRGFISGRADPGEKPSRTAHREAGEEAHKNKKKTIRLRLLPRPAKFRCLITDAPVTAYLARIIAGKAKASKEMYRFKWQVVRKAFTDSKFSPRSRQALVLLLHRLRRPR